MNAVMIFMCFKYWRFSWSAEQLSTSKELWCIFILWFMMPCSLVDRYHNFRGTCWLQLHPWRRRQYVPLKHWYQYNDLQDVRLEDCCNINSQENIVQFFFYNRFAPMCVPYNDWLQAGLAFGSFTCSWLVCNFCFSWEMAVIFGFWLLDYLSNMRLQ
jgi:hypothetical protein